MREHVKPALTKVVALVVLAVAAWILLKVVLNVVAAVAWVTAGVILLVAVAWAVSTLRSSRT